MVANEENDNRVVIWDLEPEYQTYDLNREDAWYHAACLAADSMKAFNDAGYHKQIVNRIGEAFTFVRGVITATEIDNFFHLRYHKDADPFMQELAKCMWEAYDQAEAEVLYEGEWHTPYVEHTRLLVDNSLSYGSREYNEHDSVPTWCPLPLEQALKISAAACGQVSYRKLDTSEETVERVWNNLMGGEIIHASVTGHQASPMKEPYNEHWHTEGLKWQDGATHVDKQGNFWSAQFKHWIMHRKLLDGEYCERFHTR